MLAKLIRQLQGKLEVLAQSALDAKDEATSEESKAENKYDTRGLEASYLAGAQAKRAHQLAVDIENLSKLKLNDFDEESKVKNTALIQCDFNTQEDRWFFMLPFAGGEKIMQNDISVQIITPQSPIGKLLFQKGVGDIVEINVKGETNEYEIIELT